MPNFFSKILEGKITSNINGIQIIVPKTFEGILPASPSFERFDFEPYSFLGLQSCLKSNQIAFDLGSSYGVMSTLMAMIVGKHGKVFSFEGNIEAIKKASELVSANNLQNNIKFHNFLVGDSDQKESDFYVIPGYKSVASSINPLIMNTNPDAIKKKISTVKIDDFCKKNNIHPDVVKVDIEGAEFVAISGMRDTIEKYKPDIIIETHGTEITGIGGSLMELMELLERYQYKLFDFHSGDIVSGKEYASMNVNNNSTVLITKKLEKNEFLVQLRKNLDLIKNRLNHTERKRKEESEIVDLINTGLYDQVIKKLQQLPLDSNNKEEQYYLALALHVTGINHQEALTRYTAALKQGFSPFWIHYNRGSLYYKMGEIEKALEDLKKASKSEPDHVGVRKLLSAIEAGKTFQET